MDIEYRRNQFSCISVRYFYLCFSLFCNSEKYKVQSADSDHNKCDSNGVSSSYHHAIVALSQRFYMSSLKSIELAERSSDSSGASTSNCVLRLELERQNEMKARLSLFRPQLENFARHKLFLDADLLEFPKVKELVEENEGRIPVTDDRWLAVQNILFDAVKDHANKIEDDCNGVIENAKTEALQAVKDRWFEKRTQKWEERQEKRQKEKEARERQKEEREADSDSNPSDDSEESIYDPHPSEYDDPPDHFEETRLSLQLRRRCPYLVRN